MTMCLVRNYSFAGVSQRSSITATNGRFLFYGSSPNLVIADKNELLSVVCRSSGNISVIRCFENKYISVGDENGNMDEYLFDENLRILSHYHLQMNRKIVDFVRIGNQSYVICTLTEISLVIDGIVRDSLQFPVFISCFDVLKIDETRKDQFKYDYKASDLKIYPSTVNQSANYDEKYSPQILQNQKITMKVDEDLSKISLNTFSDKFFGFIAFDDCTSSTFEICNYHFLNFKSVKFHNDTVKMCRFHISETYSQLCTVSLDETVIVQIYVHDKNCFEYKYILHGHRDCIYSCFWIDSETLLTSSADNSLIIWKMDKNENQWIISMRIGGIAEKNQTFFDAIMIDDILFAQSSSGGFYKYIIRKSNYNLVPYLSGHQELITSIDVLGDLILTTSLDFTGRIFSICLKQEIGRPQIHGFPLSASKFLNNSYHIVTGSHETILRIYSPTRIFLENYNECLKKQSENNGPSDDIFHKFTKHNTLFNKNGLNNQDICDYRKYMVEIPFNLPPMAQNAELNLTNEVVNESFENILHEGMHERNLSLYSLFAETKKVYGHPFEVQDIAVSTNYVFTSNLASKKRDAAIKIWDKSMNLIKNHQAHNIGITRLQTSLNGRYLISAARDGNIVLHEIIDKNISNIYAAKTHKREIKDCCISQKNKYFASCGKDKFLNIYDMTNLQLLYSSKFSTEPTAVTFLIQENYVCVGFADGMLKIYRVNDLQNSIFRIQAHGKAVSRIYALQDTPKIISGGADGLVNIFEVQKI